MRIRLVTLLLCLFAVVRPSGAETAPVMVGTIKVTGLHSISETELLYLLDLDTGKMADTATVRTGIKRAFLKGIFDDLMVAIKDDGAAEVTVREKKIIDCIKVVGNTTISSRSIRKEIGIESGERINALKLRKGLSRVQDELRKRGFPRPEIEYEAVPGKHNRITIVISVKEGNPETVRAIRITEPEDIVSYYLPLKEHDVFDRTKMEKLRGKVKQYYRKRGYVGTSLIYSFEDGTLEITLLKGKKLDVSFEGNAAISTRELMGQVTFFQIDDFNDELVEETAMRIVSLYHKRGYPVASIATTLSKDADTISVQFFVFEGNRYKVNTVTFNGASVPHERLSDLLATRAGGFFNPDDPEVDVETITEFYRALGYLSAEVEEPDIEMTDDSVKVSFTIKEGPQTKISEIIFRNNTAITDQQLLEAMPLKKGAPYNGVDVVEAKRKIMELYIRRGYQDATVKQESAFHDSTATVTFTISERDMTRFGKSILAGNEKTKRSVITREFVHKESQPFDDSLLVTERTNLYRLGLFSDVVIEPAGKFDSERDVLYRFSEADAGSIGFGFGYGEFEHFRGFLDLSYMNLWGMNRYGSVRAEFSSIEKRGIIAYEDLRFLGKQLTFKASLSYEDREEKNFETGDTLYRLRATTGKTGIEKKLSQTVSAQLYYELSLSETFDVQPDVVLTKEDTGHLLISALQGGLLYDTRDNVFNPSRGLFSGLSLKVAPAILFSEAQFAKMTVYVNHYQRLSTRVILALSLRGGLAESFTQDNELPIIERFFLGGRTTVRGYAQDTLGPKGSDENPTGGNAFLMGNVEFRIDVGKGFGLVTFLDWGDVWQKVTEFDLGNIKYTTGLGVRYNTPVGPVRVDYGHKLNREKGESSGEVHFSLGQAF